RRLYRSAAVDHSGCEAGCTSDLLSAGDHRDLVRTGVPARGAGRPDVPAARLYDNVRDGGGVAVVDQPRSGADDSLHSRRPIEAGVTEPDLTILRVGLRSDHPSRLALEMDGARRELRSDSADDSSALCHRPLV